MPLNLKLYHRTILPHHLKINMIFVLSLDSFLGLFVSHGQLRSLLSCCFTEEVEGPHRRSTRSCRRRRQQQWRRERVHLHGLCHRQTRSLVNLFPPTHTCLAFIAPFPSPSSSNSLVNPIFPSKTHLGLVQFFLLLVQVFAVSCLNTAVVSFVSPIIHSLCRN